MASLRHETTSETFPGPFSLQPRRRPLDGLRTVVATAPASAWVAGIITLSILVRLVVGLQTGMPWLVPDELVYTDLARSFAKSGHFAVLGAPFSTLSYGPLYPVLVAPFYRFTGSATEAYALVKVFNAVLISTAAVPAYLLARRVVARGPALVAASVAVLLPSTVYASKAMTESLAYPVFLFAILAIARAVEWPTAPRYALALATIFVGVATRAQMIALLPALIAARVGFLWIAKGRFPIRRRSLVRAAVATIAGVAVVATVLVRDGSSALGPRHGFFSRMHLIALPKWLLYHVAELDLAVGVVPVAAFVLIAVLTFRRDINSRGLAAFVATVSAASASLLLLVALYATQPRVSPLIYERYLFYLEPLFVIGLLAWIELRMPGGKRLRTGIGAGAAVLPALLPFHVLVTGHLWGVNSATTGLVPWASLGGVVGKSIGLPLAVLIVSSLLAAIFIRRDLGRSRTLLLAVVAVLGMTRMLVDVANVGIAANARDFAFPYQSQPDWIDNAVGRDAVVVGVWVGRRHAPLQSVYSLMQSKAANDSLQSVYRLHEPFRPELSGPKARFVDGTLRSGGEPIRAEYVVTDRELRLRGIVIASMGRLELYRVNGLVLAAGSHT
jgi:hypothetical protein